MNGAPIDGSYALIGSGKYENHQFMFFTSHNANHNLIKFREIGL